MYAISIREPGGPDVLEWTEHPDPEPGPGEVIVDVVASAVNRADVLQRQGNYPPPAGASEVPGLECAGRIAALGEGVEGWSVGDPVCALLAGGGYAEKVAVPAPQLMPVPEGLSLTDAGGLPEVACTAWSNLSLAGRLQAGETLLVHGGTAGSGRTRSRSARRCGARVLATAGSPERQQTCLDLGADVAIDYHDDLPARSRAPPTTAASTSSSTTWAPRTSRRISRARDRRAPGDHRADGRAKTEINLGAMLGRRLSISATDPARARGRGPRRQGRDRRRDPRPGVAPDRPGPGASRDPRVRPGR